MVRIHRNWLGVTLAAFSVISIFVMLKTSEDPIAHSLAGTWVDTALRQFPTGNDIGFDLSVGFLVSVWFYFLVVVLPARAVRSRMKRHLVQQFRDFKIECLHQFLWACGETDRAGAVQRLLAPAEFKSFFNAEAAPGVSRWSRVQRALQADPLRMARVVERVELFRVELEFALTMVDIPDARTFEAGRRLCRMLLLGTHWKTNYDDVPEVAALLWSIHTGWNEEKGERRRDLIAEFIEGL